MSLPLEASIGDLTTHQCCELLGHRQAQPHGAATRVVVVTVDEAAEHGGFDAVGHPRAFIDHLENIAVLGGLSPDGDGRATMPVGVEEKVAYDVTEHLRIDEHIGFSAVDMNAGPQEVHECRGGRDRFSNGNRSGFDRH